jgi:two-component system sensor histidine kinase UhpB
VQAVSVSVRDKNRPSPLTALYRRLFVINGLLFTAGTLLLAVSPVTISAPAVLTEIPVLIVGLTAILAANAILVRASLSPLEGITDVMQRVDLMQPGDRMTPSGNGDLGYLITSFNSMLERLENERTTSAGHALAAQEAERSRIARELHDEIGQSLTVALLALKRVVDRAPAALAEDATLAQDAVRNSLDDVREVAQRLRPGVLADLGLASALNALAGEFSRSSGLPLDVRIDAALTPLDADIELVLYRVAQEALTNVARHAQASRAELSITLSDSGVELVINDDGVGGELAEGTGIRGMRERAVLVGGKLSITSEPAGGTSVTLTVPVEG